tara:strand:- start:743 stop:1309 length:567 start_codon:yes stop_codon:yes gene_type:complete
MNNLHCVGNISYWHSILQQEYDFVHTNHTFQKQSYLSQFEIMTSNGRLKLSIPTQKPSRKGMFNKVLIDYSNNWQIEMWRSIQNAYSKSPFFLYYGYKIKEVILKKNITLMDFNWQMFNVVSKCIHLPYDLKLDQEEVAIYNQNDYKDLPSYPQVFDDRWDFEPNLSIIDLLFNLGPETIDYLLGIRV